MSSTTKSLLAAAAALVIAGCGGQKKTNALGGAVVQVSTYAAKVDVLNIELTISDPSNINNPTLVQQVLTRAATGDVFTGIFEGLPAGIPLTFDAVAVDSAGHFLYRGSAIRTVLPNQTAQVAILLQEIATPPAFVNAAPLIQSLTASARTITPGGLVNVSVGAVDPNGDALQYAWSATGGTFANAAIANPVWTAPTPAAVTDYVLAVAVSDGRGATARAEFTITVSATALGNVLVRAVLHNAPVITLSNVMILPADPLTILPPYDSTLTAAVTLDQATDPARAPVTATTYLWDIPGTDGCSATFIETGTFTAPGLTATLNVVTPAADAQGNPLGTCTVTFTATDSEGATNVATTVIMVDPSVATTSAPPPRLVSSSQSSESVGAGGFVYLAADFFQDVGPVAPLWSVVAAVQGGLPYRGAAPTHAPFTDPFLNTFEQFTFPAACPAGGPVTFTLRATALDGVNLPPAIVTNVAKDFTVTFCGP